MAEEDGTVLQRESDLRWENHKNEHEALASNLKKLDETSTKALDTALVDHHREHVVHESSHAREHTFAQIALEKADATLEKRLEGMNEFRSQLSAQSATFVTRDMFDRYSKDTDLKIVDGFNRTSGEIRSGLEQTGDKFDGIIKAIIARNESDIESLRTEVQQEREIRKSQEGSINTWKWIVGFLGASGLGGVILLFITRVQ